MTTRNRLTARAQMHGEVREPGYVFILGDGEIGPCKTVPRESVSKQIVDHIGASGAFIDVPLYEEIPEEQQDDVLKVNGDAGYPEQAAVVDARRQDDARLVELGTLQAPDEEVYPDPKVQDDAAARQEDGNDPVVRDGASTGEAQPRYMEPVVVDALPQERSVDSDGEREHHLTVKEGDTLDVTEDAAKPMGKPSADAGKVK